MYLVVFGCKNLGFKNLARVKEMTNMRYVQAFVICLGHHNHPIVTVIRRGVAIIHPGSALHGALPIASGARTNLLLFLR